MTYLTQKPTSSSLETQTRTVMREIDRLATEKQDPMTT